LRAARRKPGDCGAASVCRHTGFGGREAFFDEIGGVFKNSFKAFVGKVFGFFYAEFDVSAKIRLLQIVQNFLHVFHKRTLKRFADFKGKDKKEKIKKAKSAKLRFSL
jgi:hypothetical protein